jgi:hypothetical protein
VSGPTAALPWIDKALAVARALVARDPADADEGFELFWAEHGPGTPPAPDGWRRYVMADGRSWHVEVRADGSGRSRVEPPDGAPVVATYESRGRRPTTSWLAQRLDELERGDRDPGRPLRDGDVDRLHLALEACAADHDARWLADRRASGDPPPAWMDDLQARRAWLGASGLHVGRFGLALQVAGETGAGRGAFEAPALRDVVALGSAVLSAAVDAGATGRLVELVDELRDDAEERVRAAVGAPDRAAHLEALYEALPPAIAADALVRFLVGLGTERVPEADLRRLRRIARITDELHVRLQDPFSVLLTDLEGDRWRNHVAQLAALPAAEAQPRARRMADEQLLYPRALVPALLGTG